MFQITQDYKTGKLGLDEVPAPVLCSGGILVQNIRSLISPGTERNLVSIGQANLIEKARQRPDLVTQIIGNAKREGIVATYKKVKNRLNETRILGYSSAGVVIKSACDGFRTGDRVACAGAGYASHAEIIYVPRNLAVKVPDEVNFDEAAFTTSGAIAMQGVRQVDVRIGENVAVIGLGLVGLLTAQILKASGCNVIGLDIDERRFRLAKELGCDMVCQSNWDCLKPVNDFVDGIGVDAVIITAATSSNEPITLAANLARKRGVLVVVGLVGTDIPRSLLYEKELDVRGSCSYGPGRYDGNYEEKGIDYPVGYVRWTENRNMQAFVNFVGAGRINVEKMITHRFPISKATEAYALLLNNKENSLGVLLEYPQEAGNAESKIHIPNVVANPSADLNIAFIGAGNFAQNYLLPHLVKRKGAALRGVCTSHGASSRKAAQKFGFEFCTTNPRDIFEDDSINVVFIATQHKSHGQLVIDSLRAGKNVFVEKPLCITREELDEIKSAYESGESVLLVGFNRRFSPYSEKIKRLFSNRSMPLVINYRVNAGSIPEDHWLQDHEQGGRIIGEVCHFIDLMQFMTDSDPVRIYAERIGGDDSCNAMIGFEDGSIGTVSYLANGNSTLSKERIEFFCGGRIAVLDDWRELWLYSGRKPKKIKLGMEKGYKEEIHAFLDLVRGNAQNPIPFGSLYTTTLTTFRILESLVSGARVIEKA